MRDSLLETMLPDGIEDEAERSPKRLVVDPHTHLKYLEGLMNPFEESSAESSTASSSPFSDGSFLSESSSTSASGSSSPVTKPVDLNKVGLASLDPPPNGSVSTKLTPAELELKSNLAIETLIAQTDWQKLTTTNAIAPYEQARKMCALMQNLNIRVSDLVYCKLMGIATKAGRFADADQIFDEVVRHSDYASLEVWTEKVRSLTRSNRVDEAVKTLDNLTKLGVRATPDMYVSILKSFVNSAKYTDADAMWMRMHDDGVELTADAFSTMIWKCSRKSEVERAFFYFDEMKAVGVEPNEQVFANLIRAAGTAPAWVNGYQDTITDALCLIEGKEFMPTPKLYNNVIRAFGQAGDPVAAEFYFWEMTRKGLMPSTATYDSLLYAFGQAQTIMAPKYGRYGRYVRPVEVHSADGQAIIDAGPEKFAQISECLTCTTTA